MGSTPARTEEAAAAAAHEVETRIKGHILAIRRGWVHLAADLHSFIEEGGWKALGYRSLDSWLAQPEIGLSRTQTYRLLEAHRELVVERGIDVDRLAAVDSSKIWELLPAIRRGQVDVEDALADAEALGQTDLREKYRHHPPQAGGVNDAPIEPDDFHYEKCSECGQSRKVYD